jgi:hypothetical protein
LGFAGPGLKIHVLKERSCPASALEGEGGVYNIFGARAFWHFGEMEMPENTQNDVFWVRLMDFWPESPASGVEKWISSIFRAGGNQKSIFTPESSSPVRESALLTFFTSRTPPST